MKRSKILHLLFMLAILVGSVVLTKIRSNDILTSELVVNFKGKGARFLDVEIVNKLLIQNGETLENKEKILIFGDFDADGDFEMIIVPELSISSWFDKMNNKKRTKGHGW